MPLSTKTNNNLEEGRLSRICIIFTSAVGTHKIHNNQVDIYYSISFFRQAKVENSGVQHTTSAFLVRDNS